MAPRVAGGRAPCRVPAWVERAKATLFLRKLNERSENVRFNSDFRLASEIQTFKFALFVFFKCQFLKVFPG